MPVSPLHRPTRRTALLGTAAGVSWLLSGNFNPQQITQFAAFEFID